MNELIKLIAKQAGLIASEPNGFDQNNLSKAQQKFAKLIVEECAAIIDEIPPSPQGSWSDGYYEGCRDSANVIRQHFGVKP